MCWTREKAAQILWLAPEGNWTDGLVSAKSCRLFFSSGESGARSEDGSKQDWFESKVRSLAISIVRT